MYIYIYSIKKVYGLTCWLCCYVESLTVHPLEFSGFNDRFSLGSRCACSLRTGFAHLCVQQVDWKQTQVNPQNNLPISYDYRQSGVGIQWPIHNKQSEFNQLYTNFELELDPFGAVPCLFYSFLMVFCLVFGVAAPTAIASWRLFNGFTVPGSTPAHFALALRFFTFFLRLHLLILWSFCVLLRLFTVFWRLLAPPAHFALVLHF